MKLTGDTVKKIRGLVLFTIVAAVAAVHYRECLAVCGRLLHIFFPFLLGAAIAFVLNVPMRQVERLLTGRRERKKWHRPASLLITIILVAGVLFLVVFVVTPEVLRTMVSLSSSIPAFMEKTLRQAETLFAQYPQIVDYLNTIEIDWPGMLRQIVDFLRNGATSVLDTTVSAAVSIVSGVTNFGIGFIFSIYILLQKEVLCSQAKRLVRAFVPERTAVIVIGIMRKTERTFSSFLAGQCAEALILGTMFFVTMTVLKMPYALLIGVLIAFTALIPIFGAFIGCAVGVFLMLMVSPFATLEFVAVFFILQQIEGNLIYPHVVGNSVGLPSIWVLMAVTVGGSLMGVVGMLIFIPLCSVLYSIMKSEVRRRERRRDVFRGDEAERR
ncbi:MAG TPA: AI-2E family transporter [Candidatus Lachnoclostridium pullistercoris]|uniref:AI-2E family transporter n=1 Tax=Candidatus Lachnoclostridium pullistercoris TaxID=2838632 RepID=A0A9D2PA57_9FIRM|nr:AI-2E family transporter [Candidatus Lachnoclostridium pullistercoris]